MDNAKPIFINGILAETGSYALAPLPVAELSEMALKQKEDREASDEVRFWARYQGEVSFGIDVGLDEKDLASAGWGVLFPYDIDPAIIEALRPLIDWRRSQAAASREDFFKVFAGANGYRPGETKTNWMRRMGVAAGRVDPSKIPFYLLIVGGPAQVPYPFQARMDLQYAIGRIQFDTPEQYALYAQSVVEAEKQRLRLPRQAAFFAPSIPDDPLTQQLARQFIQPLVESLQGESKTGNNWQVQPFLGEEATKERLNLLLGTTDTPALIFAASHGLIYEQDSPNQRARQGALLTQDWPGPSRWQQPLPGSFYYAGQDLSPEARLWGSIVFLSAACSAGENTEDGLQHRVRAAERGRKAGTPFLADLPKRLLAHPNGGALAVVGYTGCPWGHSVPEESAIKGSLIYAYQSVLKEVLRGAPIGSAFQYLNQNFAEMSVNLIDLREKIEYGLKYEPMELQSLWAVTHDAANAIILGDPAVRLNVFEYAQDIPVQRPVLSSLADAFEALSPDNIYATLQPITQQEAAPVSKGGVFELTERSNQSPVEQLVNAPLETGSLSVEAGTDLPTAGAVPARATASPYVGPRAFELNDRFYFGRDREARALSSLLIAERIVLLFSPSGAGKSSLINARVIPNMVEEGFRVLPTIRVNSPPPADLRKLPGFNRYIYSALVSMEGFYGASADLLPEKLENLSLETYLQWRQDQEQNRTAQMKMSKQLKYQPEDEKASTLLVFDQFEEILTTDPTDRDGRTEFFSKVGAVLRDRNRWALFVMREEYVGMLEPYLKNIPTRLSTRFRLDLLEVSAALQAILEPARAAGVHFEEAAARKLIDDLRRTRVQEADLSVEERYGPYVEPVQLQVVCSKLWQDLPETDNDISVEDVERLGNTNQALAGYYNTQLAQVSSETGTRERIIRRWFDHQLITEQGIRGQVLLGPKETAGLPNPVVRLLEKAYLIRGEKRGGATWYELAHDRLLHPIADSNSEWFDRHLVPLQKTAETWQKQNRSDGLLLTGAALEEAEKWAGEHPDEMETVEKEFLAASVKARETILREQRGARARELAIAALNNLNMDPERSMLLALAAVEATGDPQDALPSAVEALHRAVHVNYLEGTLRGHTGRIYSVTYNTTGSRILTASKDGTARVWETSTRAALTTFEGHSGSVNAARFLPQASAEPGSQSGTEDQAAELAATASSDGTIRLWNTTQGAELACYTLSDIPALCLDFSPDGRVLATGWEDGEIRFLSLPDLHELRQMTAKCAVETLAFSPDGRYLATGCRDGMGYLWNAARGSLHRTLKGHSGPVMSVAFRPDGKRLVTASADRTIRVWNTMTGRRMQRLTGPMDWVYSALYTRDGLHLVSAGADCTLRIWDPHTGLEERQFPSHAEQVFALATSPDGEHVLSAGENGTAQLWNIGPSGCRELFTLVPGGHIYSLAISPDGSALAAGTHRKEIELFDLPSGKRQTLARGHTTQVEAVVFTPNGHTLASGGRDGKIVLWDRATGARKHTFSASKPVWSLAVSPDGQRLLAGCSDGILREWQLSEDGLRNEGSPFELLRPEGVTRGVMAISVAYHPGGSHAAAGYGDGSLVVWSLAQGISMALFRNLHSDSVQEVAFSPDGHTLLSVGQDGMVHLLSVDEAVTQIQPYVRRQHHAGALFALAVSAGPQGGRFATAGVDRITRVWSLPGGEEILALHGHADRIYALAFSPDGQTLVTAGRDGSIRGYTLDPSQLVTLSRARLTRALTEEEQHMFF